MSPRSAAPSQTQGTVTPQSSYPPLPSTPQVFNRLCYHLSISPITLGRERGCWLQLWEENSSPGTWGPLVAPSSELAHAGEPFPLSPCRSPSLPTQTGEKKCLLCTRAVTLKPFFSNTEDPTAPGSSGVKPLPDRRGREKGTRHSSVQPQCSYLCSSQ